MGAEELKIILATVGPMIGPILQQLWNNSLYPKLQADLKSGSPEIQIVENAFISFLNSIVAGEIPKL